MTGKAFSRAGLLELFVVFAVAFGSSLLSTLTGLGPTPDLGAVKAVAVSALVAAVTAGFKALLSAFIKTQEPFPQKGA